jgi:hypothetical protein
MKKILAHLRNIIDWILTKLHLGFAKFCYGFDWLLARIHFNKLYKDKSKFKWLFYFNESKELLGKHSKFFLQVLGLYVLTILSLGFANDGLLFLQEKMKDPFVYYVTANLQGPFANNAANYRPHMLEQYILDADSAQKYKYDTIYRYYDETGVTVQKIKAFGLENDSQAVCFGRSVPAEDSLVSAVLKVNARNIGHGFRIKNKWNIKSYENYSIIVTYNLLERVLGHRVDVDPPFISINGFNVPIAAVVTQLPNKGDFLATDYFFEYYRSESGFKNCFQINDSVDNKLFIMVDVLPSRSDSIQMYFNNAINELLAQDSKYKDILTETRCSFNPYTLTFRETSVIQINFNEFIPKSLKEEFFSSLITMPGIREMSHQFKLSANSIMLFYNPKPECDLSALNTSTPMRLSINFKELKHVSEFSRNFSASTNIQLDLDKIKSMENYDFVTLLTYLLAGVLIFFSMISIIIFVQQIIRNHLNKIKMNLGTFKAFGIEVKAIYNTMIFAFVFLSESIALIICLIIAETNAIYGVLTLFNDNIDKTYKYFYVGGYIPIGILIAMLLISFGSGAYVIQSILKNSPGNLIHDRDNE